MNGRRPPEVNGKGQRFLPPDLARGQLRRHSSNEESGLCAANRAQPLDYDLPIVFCVPREPQYSTPLVIGG